MILLNWSEFRFCRDGKQSENGIIQKCRQASRQACMHSKRTIYTLHIQMMNTYMMHSHTYSHTNSHYKCRIEISDMIHRKADGFVGQLLRPVGMMYTEHCAHTHTQTAWSTNLIPPQPHFKCEHVPLLKFAKHEFCFKLLIICRIHLFSNVFDLNSQRYSKIAFIARPISFIRRNV